MKDQFKRILNLVQTTGDTMIVTDPDGENAYVIMGIDKYADLRGVQSAPVDAVIESASTELNQISQEFDDFYPVEEVLSQDNPDHDEGEAGLTIWDTMAPAGKEGETWDLSKMSENEMDDLEEQYQKYAQEQMGKRDFEAVSKPEIEENAPKLAENEDEFGEEQFYLEPIE